MRPIPERRALRRELRSSFYRRLWNTPQTSPSTLDGVVRCVPDTSSPGPLTQHSGLSRAQQLVVFSACSLPLVPVIFGEHGGVSLDKACPLIAGNTWWSSLLFRVKLQQYLQKKNGTFKQQLGQLNSGEFYGLLLKARANLGRNTTFDAKAEAQSISDLGTGCVDGQETSERVRSNSAGLTVRADVTHKLGGNKLCVSGAFQDRFQCQTKTVCLPAVLSAELASDLKDGCLHYKIGIHEVFGKTTIDDCEPFVADEVELGGHYVQGGIGIDGVLTLCGGNRRSVRRRSGQANHEKLSNSYSTAVPDVGHIEPQKNLKDADRTAIPLSNGPNISRDSHASQKTIADTEVLLENLRGQIVSVKEFSKDLLNVAQQVRREGLISMLPNGHSTGNKSRSFPRVFLPNPHLKVGAILGATGCWRMRHMAGSSSSVRLDMPSLPQSSSVPSVRRRPFRFSLRDATAQLFCGGSVSAQIGHMKRSFLDFSSILAQLEVSVPLSGSPGRYRRGRLQGARSNQNLTAGISKLPFVPILNVSLVQQAIGPVRVKADYNFSLDSHRGGLGATSQGIFGGVVDHVKNLQPTLLDVQYGVDFSVPGTHGAVRVGGWYTPSRKEGMVELRMM